MYGLKKVLPLNVLDPIVKVNESVKITWTNGVFDLIHAGHISSFEYAKRCFGPDTPTKLVVGVNSDQSASKIKSADRPLCNLKERLTVLSAIEFIDFIVVFEGDDCLPELLVLKPHAYIKGGDYTVNTVNQDERKLVESYGGIIRIAPRIFNISTSKLVSKIKNI